MKELFVSGETASKLKDLGYNERWFVVYVKEVTLKLIPYSN